MSSGQSASLWALSDRGSCKCGRTGGPLDTSAGREGMGQSGNDVAMEVCTGRRGKGGHREREDYKVCRQYYITNN